MESIMKLPFSPSNILARLDELKRWQKEQQERLLLQQTQQRELLSHEQRRMYQAFSLNNSYETTVNSPQINTNIDQSADCHESQPNRSDICLELKDSTDEEENDMLEGQNSQFERPDEIILDKPRTCNYSFDDTPVNANLTPPTITQYSADKPKRPFLKRGEGLARFRMTKGDIEKIRSKSKNRPRMVHADIRKSSVDKPTRSTMLKKSNTTKSTNKKLVTTSAVKKHHEQIKCKAALPILTKPTSSISHKTKSVVEEDPVISVLNRDHLTTVDSYEKILNELRTKRDTDDLKIFELLEEKAENSSFCSTNSAVELLMNQEDNSTPRLKRTLLHQLHSKIQLAPSNNPTSDIREKQTSPHVHFCDKPSKDNTTDFESDLDTSVDYDEIVKTSTNIPKIAEELFNDEKVWSDNDSIEDQSQITEINRNLKDAGTMTDNFEQCNNRDTTEFNEQTNSDTEVVFKSQLLKSRLQELENEIEIFRRENAKIIAQKQELDNEQRMFLKKKNEKEKQLAEEKISLNAFIEEEKKKITKEKMVFEKYTKEVMNQPTRKEREEMLLLKKQLHELKEEMKVKDSKYGATQARLRTQIKHLEKEIDTLKVSNEQLKRDNKKFETRKRPPGQISNTKILHEINKNLSKILPKDVQATTNAQSRSLQKVVPRKNQARKQPTPQLTTLTIDSSENDDELTECNRRRTVSLTHDNTSSEASSDNESDCEQNVSPITPQSALYHVMYGNGTDRRDLQKHAYFPTYGATTTQEAAKENDSNVNNTRDNLMRNMKSIEEVYEMKFGKQSHEDKAPLSSRIEVENIKEQKNETLFPDGRKEVQYANGNIKKISPDGKIVKLVYYNGDIKESDLTTGTIKYYYAATSTWHTQYPDGSEILEFNNGQIEKLLKNGCLEIRFPNGSTKNVDEKGNQKWQYADGSSVSMNKHEKVIQLSNGQREIHTEQHKRREYPDGTVKILYPDGTTETRYANGRVRIKDQHGKLMMDSDHS